MIENSINYYLSSHVFWVGFTMGVGWVAVCFVTAAGVNWVSDHVRII